MHNLNTNKIFLSAYRTERTDATNQVEHFDLMKKLNKLSINYTVLEGVYNGVSELSIMLFTNDANELERYKNLALKLADEYDQESILLVHNDNTSELLDVFDGEVFGKGVFREVSEAEALASKSFTHNPRTGSYYTVKTS